MSADENTRETSEDSQRSSDEVQIANGGVSDPKPVNSFQLEEVGFSTLKRFFYGAIFVVLILSIPSAYHMAKRWRANGFVEKSWRAFGVGDVAEGLSYLRKAAALSPGSPTVQNAVELYNARVGDANSLHTLISQMNAGLLDNQELLGIAEIEAAEGREKEASEALRQLPKILTAGESLRRTLVEATLFANAGNISQAASTCLSAAVGLEPREAGFLKIHGAQYLMTLHDSASDLKASDILLSVVRENTDASQVAWRIESARVLAALPTDTSKHLEIPELLKLLPTLSKAGIRDQLLAAEMEMLSDPSRKEAVLEGLIERYQNGDRSMMLELARWFNSKGYQAQAIALAGEERPRVDTDWLLIVLDAKSAQGLWDEVSKMLESPASEGIPDAVRYMFLARSARMKGDHATEEDDWSNVRSSLHLEKPETLAYIAGYEEQIGAIDEAARTYREMANREETRKAGMVALIRMQPPTTSAETMIPLYEDLITEAPEYADAVGDLDYLKLLTGDDIPRMSADAEKLLTAQPTSLARISTAALGRLKLGDTKGAMELYEGKTIDWSAAPPPWRVVRSAVLRAAGEYQEADKMAATIDPAVLRPEEADLLKSNSTSTGK